MGIDSRSASIKETEVKSKLPSDSAATNQCPSINCSHVCARAQVNEVISSAKEEIFTASKDAHLSSTNGQASKLDDTLLFVGIISGRGYRHRRLAVRDAWASRCQVPGVSVCRFILSDDEVTELVQEEMQEHNDIVLVHGETTYKSILLKTLFVFEYAVSHYDARFILKTDDDAFVHTWAMVQQLRLLCESPDCRRERLYMGKQCRRGEVILTPGHRWNNADYYNHTGLETYANYMFGGGYILSADVAQALVHLQSKVSLKFTPIEDATIGFWVMGMDLRQIDHPKMNSNFWPCCFKALERRPGEKQVTGFQLDTETEADICSDDPWIVLHKLDSPSKMRYIGARVAACPEKSGAEALVVPASIAPWVAKIGKPGAAASKADS
ncbi:g8696 [Coccomyxa elongata]